MAKGWTVKRAIEAGASYRLEPRQAASIAALLTVGREHLPQWVYVERTLQTGYVRSVAKFNMDTDRNGRYWLKVFKDMEPAEVLSMVPGDQRFMTDEYYRQRLQKLEDLGCLS